MSLTQESTSHYVQTKDWRMHYNEVGENGPALIMLHGSGPGASGWSNFQQNLPELAKHFRVFALDMIGWGGSDPAPYPNRDTAEAVIQFIETLGLEKVAIVGNSLGAMTALQVTVRRPELVSHVITMGSGSQGLKYFSPGDGLSEGMKVLVETYANPSAEQMAKLVEVMTYDPKFTKGDLAEKRSAAARSTQVHLDNYNEARKYGPGNIFVTDEELAMIKIPVLLIHGRDDRVCHIEHSLKLVTAIANSRLLLINRCGHWAQLEHPEEFNRAVTDFVLNAK
jgi:2-hydroxy-6-oxonona-2,4-dienedioate hydrolase